MAAPNASRRRAQVATPRHPVEFSPGVFRVRHPIGAPAPLLFESPHSGRYYPADFASPLALRALRGAEDAFVDRLLASAPAAGATVLEALFPRAYIDPNRAEDDLDPDLLAGPWPGPLRPGAKTALGIGLVRRLVAPGLPIYARKLTVAEVRHRLEAYRRPYRARLEALVVDLARAHGRLLIVQWHSMKARGNAATPDGPGAVRAAVVLGDRHGRTAPAALVDRIAASFTAAGLGVARNAPYAGTAVLEALTTLAPDVTAVQVELNRGLYLDEAAVVPHAGFADLAGRLAGIGRELAALARAGW